MCLVFRVAVLRQWDIKDAGLMRDPWVDRGTALRRA